MLSFLIVAAALTAPAFAATCPNPMLRAGERMSREGGETFVSIAMNNPDLLAHGKQRPAIRAQLETAVLAEQPDWRSIEQLLGQEKSWKAELARLGHVGEVRIIRALGRRDRAIYLRMTVSGTPSAVPGLAMKENRERSEAVRLEILAAANCLVPDAAKLEALLAERLSLELERQNLAFAWSEGLYATEGRTKRIERLRREYRSGTPLPVFSMKPSTPDDPARDKPQ